MIYKKILITGGAGFIGSHFCELLLQTYPNIKIYNLDLLTYAADKKFALEYLPANYSNYEFIQADIANQSVIYELFSRYKFDSVVHFAAESHVDNSIKAPDQFIHTNINGTYNLLAAARLFWEDKSKTRFLHVSTDEVYGSLKSDCKTTKFTESSPYSPNSPYSASKASSDHLVRAFNKTYDLNTIITNCTNNFGPRQHSEKLIPTIIKNALNNQTIGIYGTGENIRDWIYVTDHCKLILEAFLNGKNGESYNIGSDCELSNIAITNKILNILDKRFKPNKSYKNLIKFVKDRQGHDFRYALNNTKILQLTNYNFTNFEIALENTINWYIINNSDLKICRSQSMEQVTLD